LQDDQWAVSVTARIGRGDRAAMSELYEARYAMLFSLIRERTLRDDDFACDCVHDAWLRILRRTPALPNVATLDAWLVRVAMSAAIDRIKRDRARLRREGERAFDELSAATGTFERLTDELAKLERDDEVALSLRYLRGRPLDAVAEVFGITLRAAESRVRRALERLRGQWKEVRDE
jgi:RNA polymerase sigma factor (sigma-70 family)